MRYSVIYKLDKDNYTCKDYISVSSKKQAEIFINKKLKDFNVKILKIN